MDINIYSSGLAINHEKANGKFVLHDCILICFIDSSRYGLAVSLLKYRLAAAGQAEATPRGLGRRDVGQADSRGRPGREVGVAPLQAPLGRNVRLLAKQTDRLGFQVMEVDEGLPFLETPKHDQGVRYGREAKGSAYLS